ncbi:N-acetyl-gamma-glutamyl-phosphate reductase [Sinanaerobacter chloroacetimidivorans]|uniref:N-acetyl-gamma-glutamyl-phosphate reductase n=1 Tax=Sinanaerobacter chloroacetimidivorans TaxID=2818044 RepID=A0A8J7W393_9FIRM|nr:N-acetyl-gamma-glutamyl-phosphate reductase [Sinanaerobacter chloroacetimidivorans]MBR0599689.1 N-acetyl-gamma-glutamyl-phosphate reductase [Sinanaerobacter chloroacetimidivorans]
MAYKIYIDGQEGTTGLKIQERFHGRNDVEVLKIPEEYRKDQDARLEMMKLSDITFLCLPDAASREIAGTAEPYIRILDTSTAHRTNADWVYGMPELNPDQRARIQSSNRVSVPGCHATGFIMLVKPLISLGIADRDYPFICHSITGYSGGGKNMIAQYGAANRGEDYNSPRQYGLPQNHKHLAEMRAMTEIKEPPVFHPIVADYYSGMLVTVSLHRRLLKKKLTSEELLREFKDYYNDQPVIHIMDYDYETEDGFLPAGKLSDSDKLEIYILGQEERISLIARYDNLGKGASGAAVQCMNIMLGLPEETGLQLK